MSISHPIASAHNLEILKQALKLTGLESSSEVYKSAYRIIQNFNYVDPYFDFEDNSFIVLTCADKEEALMFKFDALVIAGNKNADIKINNGALTHIINHYFKG